MINRTLKYPPSRHIAPVQISYIVQTRLEELVTMIEFEHQKILSSYPANVSGVKAIFCGIDDGVASAAAQLLAARLVFSLQIIDISQLYDQYCDEVEHRLECILDDALSNQVIVLFDQVDELFGYDSHASSASMRRIQLDVSCFLTALASHPAVTIIRTREYFRLDQSIMRQFACVIDLDDGIYPVQRRFSALV